MRLTGLEHPRIRVVGATALQSVQGSVQLLLNPFPYESFLPAYIPKQPKKKILNASASRITGQQASFSQNHRFIWTIPSDSE